MRVVFAGGGTGGHLYPGLAIARALVRERADVRPHFVGARRGIEHRVLPDSGFPFTLLDVHPLYRSRPWRNWRTVAGGVAGWRAMRALAREDRPALVVGTGGYASAIPVLWAAARGVPVVQHIGDAIPGLAARSLARFSRECYLGFSDAAARLGGVKAHVVVTGNPVEPPPQPRPARDALLVRWGLPPASRVLLAFGGSQGARALNEALAGWVQRGIPEGWSVIWGTGAAQYGTYAHLASERVHVAGYLSPIADAYAVADLAVVRGGMMGTAELCAWGVPMVVVPLPTAAADHQTWNARALEAAGAAVHVPERELTPERLAERAGALMGSPERLRTLAAGASAYARPDAARNIALRIAAILDEVRA